MIETITGIKEPYSKKQHYFLIFVWIVFFVGFVLMIHYIYQLVQPYKAIDIKTFHTVKNIYEKGEALTLNVDYCKYEDVRAEVYPELINDRRYFYADYFSNFPIGCNKLVLSQWIIPFEIPEGTYTFKVTTKVEVNPYKTIIQEFQTNEFSVITKL